MSEEKKKRIRRTKSGITEDIRKAAIEQILKRGFSSSLVTEIIKTAKIEPPVFYHRYKDLDEFYSEFVKGYDYWFSDIVYDATQKSDDPKTQFLTLIKGLLDTLKGESVMQELLRWEVAETNDTTRKTATLREMFTLPMTEKYKDLFSDTKIDFVAFASIMISGIYYLNLHRRCSTFCGIDMNKEEDVERINQTIRTMTEVAFSFLDKKDAMQEAAERMRAKGIDEQTIRECLMTES